MKYALVSVYDKTNLNVLVESLVLGGYKILSTGGTYEAILEILNDLGKGDDNIALLISEYTNSPEILNGRVKTLHPKICGGILANRHSSDDMFQINELNIPPIDIVAVNLYPYQSSPTIEMIDIGGVTLLRAAAKNYEHVLVLSEPSDYYSIGEMLYSTPDSMLKFRKYLAAKAFKTTANYDNAISSVLANS